MLIELWKDKTGYRLGFDHASYDLTPESYATFLAALQTFQKSEPGEYAKCEYELQDWDGERTP